MALHDIPREVLTEYIDPCDVVALARTSRALHIVFGGNRWPFPEGWFPDKQQIAYFLAHRPKWAAQCITTLVRHGFYRVKKPYLVGVMGQRFVMRWPPTKHGKWGRGPDRGVRHRQSLLMYPRIIEGPRNINASRPTQLCYDARFVSVGRGRSGRRNDCKRSRSMDKLLQNNWVTFEEDSSADN